ncbi:NAD-dependent epimerase/dehydratase family protein [uncultured Parasphingopyxis sp.]|uniref:NAD-dependent epimerase/dehydratase family protein n=1 Tax=uncultured Parasphingopyxis sp. TaxID=1547918 RepID=UPI002609E84E|nr:NAD-dependent epimerase/dehydratase family protein [uncultured Parasphingopyxis sp.]
MKLLVTGGAGFVGSNLIARLEETGDHEIVVLDDESMGSREAIADLDAGFVKGDIRDADVLDRIMPGVDAVVHLAADTRVIPSIENPAVNLDVNVNGTFEVLQAMRRHDVGTIVAASTGGAIMGEVEPPVHEQMVPSPGSPYGASKLAMEGYLSAFSTSYGMKCAALRFSNVYGPRSWHKGSVVAHFIKQIFKGEPLTVYGDGGQTRDYVFAEDLSDGIIQAITSDATGAIQLGTGIGTPLNDIIDMLRDISGKDFEVEYEPFRAGEVVFTYCDISHARETIGYSPDTGLREGLERTWNWFADNREKLSI